MANKNNIAVTAYLTPQQNKALNKLTELTRVLKSVYLREAVDDMLKKYSKTMRGKK